MYHEVPWNFHVCDCDRSYVGGVIEAVPLEILSEDKVLWMVVVSSVLGCFFGTEGELPSGSEEWYEYTKEHTTGQSCKCAAVSAIKLLLFFLGVGGRHHLVASDNFREVFLKRPSQRQSSFGQTCCD